jgi:murein L,D-transpeptidase YcbB/YkuD
MRHDRRVVPLRNLLFRCLALHAGPLALALLFAFAASAEPFRFGPAQARVAVELLGDASSHGLDPDDYEAQALRQSLAQASPLDADASARRDQALGVAMLRYLQDLHDGRAAPASMQRVPFDAAATLRAALALQDLPLAVRQAVPPLAQYERLREALAQYRRLASHAAWQSPWPALPRVGSPRQRKLEPGQPWEGLALLSARLVALGDLGAQDAASRELYDGALVAAVERFQQRHGLQPDGVIGAATHAALQVTPRQRVRQLELALERLRWTPLLAGPRMVVINIPEFVLRAYEVQGDRIEVRQSMKVIVGKALDTRTPLIHEPMRRIEFNPYWNVPSSIARKELVPRLRRDPAYWEREGFEFVGAQGAADAVLDAAKLDAVLGGRLRIRQRPGPRNALGDIKFVFPNRESIYLHHTPSVQLFERARRDFSHGCIRVEQPVALAQFVLDAQPGWDERRIRDAMARNEPSTVALAQPLPVLIAYGTALVKQSQVYFFDDIYGHDRALDAALRQRASTLKHRPDPSRPSP